MFERGLKTDSCVRCDKLATLDRRIVLGEIGQLSRPQTQQVDKALSFVLGIDT